MKYCVKCNSFKPYEDFSMRKASSDSLQYYCKSCYSRGQKEYFNKFKPKITKSQIRIESSIPASLFHTDLTNLHAETDSLERFWK
jgi:hypothetical protein